MYIELPGNILMKVPQNLIVFPESFQVDRIPLSIEPHPKSDEPH
jgi:hypothetical protein